MIDRIDALQGAPHCVRVANVAVLQFDFVAEIRGPLPLGAVNLRDNSSSTRTR
jgi:hypothetical protein